MQPIYVLYIKPFSLNNDNSKVIINISVYLLRDWLASLKWLNLCEVEASSGLVPAPGAWGFPNSAQDFLGEAMLIQVDFNILPIFVCSFPTYLSYLHIRALYFI